MQPLRLSAAIGLFLVLAASGLAHDAKYPATYEGGSLPLDHSKVKATLLQNEVVLVQHGRKISVPAGSITEIACAVGVHRRTGASVLDVVPKMHLGETENHYVGMAWTQGEDASAGKVEVLFKLSKSEYAAFLSGLERMTGKKAVDTNQTLTAVRY